MGKSGSIKNEILLFYVDKISLNEDMKFTDESLLPTSFYARNPTVVAENILGKIVVRRFEGIVLAGKVVEVEAYLGSDDPAAHSFIGKTKRNEVLFGNPGYTYVHSIHKYYCMDIVCEGKGNPGSVLIRALEPILGIDIMKVNRSTKDVGALCSGPGKLCQALKITRELNGVNVTRGDSPITIYDSNLIFNKDIITSQRIGISKAKELPLRFSIKENTFVSK